MKLVSFEGEQFFLVLKKLNESGIPPRVAYQVKTLLEFMAAENKKFQELRSELLNKYGEKDEKDKLKTTEKGGVIIPPTNLEAFNKEFQELHEVEITPPVRLKLSDLYDKEEKPYILLTGQEVATVGDLLEP